VLHVDPNDFYGAAEAAFSLQEVDDWAGKNRDESTTSIFAAAEVTKPATAEEQGLSFPRAYSIVLAPQIIHTKSELLSQLVSSKAFRQVEFLAVGSFYIFQPPSSESSTQQQQPSLSRIPSTREDVFASTAIPTRAKRSLMKFLKFVLEYDANTEVWKHGAGEPLVDFLASEFKLDERLRADVMTLTLSLDGAISVGDGLAAIHRHMTSMGLFGAGFAAVYPKWGGLSEVAQVGCRAGAVGGAVYMLGTGVTDVQKAAEEGGEGPELPLGISLSNGISIRTKTLVQPATVQTGGDAVSLSRLTAIVNSDMSQVFEAIMEGAPTPAVAVVAFPPGYIPTDGEESSKYPIYAMLHSSDTGECPAGQCVVYLSTLLTPTSRNLLEKALSSLLAAVANGESEAPSALYKLYYEQTSGSSTSVDVDGAIVDFPPLPLDLAFNDAVMGQVRAAWDAVTKGDEPDGSAGYMKFEDREGAVDDDNFD